MFSEKNIYWFDYEIINLNLSNLFRNSKFCRKNIQIPCAILSGQPIFAFLQDFLTDIYQVFRRNKFLYLGEKIAQKACHE
jgi:hypothetical protein